MCTVRKLNSFRRKTRSKALHEFKLHCQEKFLYVCDTLHMWEWEVRVLDIQEGVEATTRGQQTIRQKTADAMDAARGPSFAADQDEGPQRGSGRPIPPLVTKIQVATTNAGARAQSGLTPDFLALSN